MEKKKTAVPAFLGVAAVWIGSHFGPGFATGAFSVRWYVKYGWVGLVTPLLAMFVTGGVMYYMLEYAREHGTPGYRPFARSCYGEKLGGVVAVLYDVCFLMTMMCAGGLAFSGEGKLLQGFLGINYWTTAIVTILVSAALCLYGSKLLAKSSGYMMYAIVGVVLLITVLALTRGDCDVTGAFANSAANAKDSSFLHAILGAMQYGCFQSTIVFNVMSVSDMLKDKREARKAILSGYVITIVLMVCLIFTLFSYTNVFDVCAETLPVMAVLNRLGMKWLQWLYVILMTLAVLTSAAGLAHAGNVRFDGLFQFIPNKQLRRFVITAILLGIAAFGAALGFQLLVALLHDLAGRAKVERFLIFDHDFITVRVFLQRGAVTDDFCDALGDSGLHGFGCAGQRDLEIQLLKFQPVQPEAAGQFGKESPNIVLFLLLDASLHIGNFLAKRFIGGLVGVRDALFVDSFKLFVGGHNGFFDGHALGLVTLQLLADFGANLLDIGAGFLGHGQSHDGAGPLFDFGFDIPQPLLDDGQLL